MSIFCECLAETLEKTQDKEERSYGSVMMERLTGSRDGRVDHVLQVCISALLFFKILTCTCDFFAAHGTELNPFLYQSSSCWGLVIFLLSHFFSFV